MVLICAVGIGLIGYSRYQAQHPVVTTTSTTTTIGPGPGSKWYAALTIDICGKVSTLPVSSNPKASGITSVGNGLLFINPSSAPNFQDFSGDQARLSQFVIYYKPRMVLTSTEIQLPQTGKTPERLWRNGDKCGSQPGLVQIKSWKTTTAPTGTIVHDPTKLKFSNGQMITVAFLPQGAPIPTASRATQALLNISVEQASQPPSTSIPVPATSTTVKGPTTTTKPGATSTTKPPASSSTTSSTTKP
jgi:hypothetical protein